MNSIENTYGKSQDIRLHFDPLQSFIIDGKPVGFRVHIVPARGSRPREQSSLRSHKNDKGSKMQESSILRQITRGKIPSIPIAGDDLVLGSPLDQPQKHDLSEFKGLAIVNKFSPLGLHLDDAGGTALVIFPTKYAENLDNPELNFNLMRAMRTAVRGLLLDNIYRDDLFTPISFFNIGPTSGASLRQLHAQTYCTTQPHGLLTYSFNQSFRAQTSCLICNMTRNTSVKDHLGQIIPVDKMTVWEDNFVRLLSPFAPIRPLGLRILPKQHFNYLGDATDGSLKSLGTALAIGHKVIAGLIPGGWAFKYDRTVAFRQSQDIRNDFHCFIDLMPSIPLGGSEVIDSLSISSIDPLKLVKKMKIIVNQAI